MKKIFTICILLASQIAFAQAPLLTSGLTSEDLAVRDRARRKMFAGGIDEEPLKVQAQLPVLKSKFETEDDEPAPLEDSD